MKVAIYVRVSTAEQAQEGYSIPAQISILNEYSKAFGYDIYKIYQDAGISGKDIDGRPALKTLIKDAECKKFNTVLVWKLSRLSRSLLDLLSIVDIFNKHNISFQSYSEKFDTSTPIGKMLLQLLGSIAEFERNTIAENVKMGLGERFKQGYSKGAIPFGYRHENKQAIINQDQADIVKHIFNTYLANPDGNCLTSLAEELNLKGFRTRTGGLWSRNVVKDMLINHFYVGHVRTGIHSHGRKFVNASVIKGSHEAIISEEIFNKVNEKLNAKKRETVIRHPDNDSILTGLIICPLCGAKMFALNTQSKRKNKAGVLRIYPVRTYRCNNKDKGKGICKGIYVQANRIEPQFIEIIQSYVSDNTINEAKGKIVINKNNDGIKNIEKELKNTIVIKNKYFNLFETGKVNSAMFADKINEILEKINTLEKEKDSLLSLPDTNINPMEIISKVKDFLSFFGILSNIEKKALLRCFVREIVITKDKTLDYVLFKSGQKVYYHK
jgi:site-specific DNA recombinase